MKWPRRISLTRVRNSPAGSGVYSGMSRTVAKVGVMKPSPPTRRRGVLAAGLLLVHLAVQPAAGLVTVPWTLWDLTREADLVVLARVVTLLPPQGLSHRIGLDVPPVAVLEVEETWKGWAPGVVFVAFEPTICPDSPVYVPGESVVAFLERGWFPTVYRTVGLSFGTRYPSPEEVADVRHMVRSVLNFRRTGASLEEQRRAWMVEAAGRPGTPWDGLYGLVPWTTSGRWDFPNPPVDPVQHGELTEQELAAILEGFVESPPTDRSLPMALVLAADRRDARIDEAAVSAVEDLLAREWEPSWYRPGWLLDAIALVLERYGDPDPAARLAPLKRDVAFVAPDALEAAWRTAKAELGIP